MDYMGGTCTKREDAKQNFRAIHLMKGTYGILCSREEYEIKVSLDSGIVTAADVMERITNASVERNLELGE